MKEYPKVKPASYEHVQSLLKAAESSTVGFSVKYPTTPLAQKIKAAKARFGEPTASCTYWQEKQKELDG